MIVNYCETTISLVELKWKNGDSGMFGRGVRFHTINRICYYLQCDVGDILKFDGELGEEDE